MKKVELGKTGIEVSRLGIGTGTGLPSGYCVQALMDTNGLARLLLYSLDCGINHWDTAFQYNTYPHIKEALKQVRRTDVVLTTKFSAAYEKDTIRDFNITLKDLNIDYVDVCLLHGVRTNAELQMRSGALNAMVKLKKEGKVRAIGLSSHGLSALKSVLEIPELDLVWARINYAGLNMDSECLGMYDQMASVYWLKKCYKLLPERVKLLIRPKAGLQPIPEDARNEVEETLQKIHSQSKGIVGMKVLAEGMLRDDAEKAVKYVNSHPFVDSFIIGMLNKEEIDENCRIVNAESREPECVKK
ncbi:MAG: aldo/keto reductase [Planctomycetota bacterium]|jgi:predicted aldo/keto reductase-like oxidoreductase